MIDSIEYVVTAGEGKMIDLGVVPLDRDLLDSYYENNPSADKMANKVAELMNSGQAIMTYGYVDGVTSLTGK